MQEIGAHLDKYACVERERRFLVAALPPDRPAVRTVDVVDRYFEGTGLRLRRMTDRSGSEPMHLFKLSQKIPEEGRPDRGLITNTYLSEKEYEVLAGVRAPELRKTRYSIPPMGVDVFAAPLDGLILAEAEFDTDAEMAAFEPPSFVSADIGHPVHRRRTGARHPAPNPWISVAKKRAAGHHRPASRRYTAQPWELGQVEGGATGS
jgi:hypothetical protein